MFRLAYTYDIHGRFLTARYSVQVFKCTYACSDCLYIEWIESQEKNGKACAACYLSSFYINSHSSYMLCMYRLQRVIQPLSQTHFSPLPPPSPLLSCRATAMRSVSSRTGLTTGPSASSRRIQTLHNSSLPRLYHNIAIYGSNVHILYIYHIFNYI